MRTSFHHQPEAQHPIIFRLIHKLPADYPIFAPMCGRLRVGKSFLHVSSIGRCGHVFGL